MNDRNHKYKSFKEFYPFYLSQHKNKTSRILHVLGSFLIILLLVYVFISGRILLLLIAPVIGYGFAWVGHFFFEKNKPATFQYPFYSLLGDWVMFWQFITGQLDKE